MSIQQPQTYGHSQSSSKQFRLTSRNKKNFNLTLCLKEPEKEQTKPKVSTRKNIIKIRGEIK